MPHSLVVTEFNELVVMGTTGSSNFPTTAGSYSTSFSGGDSVVYDNVISFPHGVDIYVSKFSEDGSQLLGSTYVGGTKNDGLNFKRYYTIPDPINNINFVEMHGNDSLYFNYGDGARGEVIVDNKNMIYVGTNTFSSDFDSGINPGFQTASGGGQDGIVFKFNSNLTQMLWSSYLGGNQEDAIFSLSLSSAEEVLVSGGTVSHNFPVTTGAYHTSFYGGSTDAFVAKINQNGNSLIASTYFGSTSYDNAFFVRTDRFDNVFICGQTKATGSTLIQNAGYSVPNSGQFITKFNPSLSSVIWSTVFGTGSGKPNISITAFAVDVCNRVYLSGWGREWVYSYYNAQASYYTWESIYGTKGMAVTSDALQTTTDGQDFYVLVLSEDASTLEYASFFGEVHYTSCGYSGHDHVDGGTSRFDKKGHIIQSVCASCGGCQQFPTSPNPGAWSTNNDATNCNNAVFKIRIIENLAEANFDPTPIGCAPYIVNFNNTSQGSTFVWNFGDGSPTTSVQNPSHTYTVGGEYTVSLIVGDPLSCNFYDTITRVITVVDPGASHLPDIQICPGQNTIIGPTGSYAAGTTFTWTPASNLNNSHIQNPVANPPATTDYLLVATGVCVDSVYQRVIVYIPDLDILVSNDTMICPGGQVVLHASTTGIVNSWQWSNSASFATILSTTQNLTISPTANTTYYVRARENVCNSFVQEQVNVTIHQFNYTMPPAQIICQGGTTHLTVTNQNSADVLSYSWQPTSQILSGANTNSPLVGPTVATTYYVTITNQMGCTTSAQVQVTIDNLIFNTPILTHNPCYDDCEGSASVLATGMPPYSYEWSNDMLVSSINGLCAGTYTVTVTDNNSCTAQTSVIITQPPQLLASFINVVDPECDGVGYGSATVVPTGGTPTYSYQWSYGGGNYATNNVMLVGLNTVTITDVNSCVLIQTITLPAPGTLTSNLSSYEMISCYGLCDGNITVAANLGTPPYQFNWSNGQHGATITGLCPGAYTVSVVDAENCVSHQYIYISQPDTLIAQATITDAILCFGQTGNIAAQVFGGTPPYTFDWSSGSNESYQNNVGIGTYYVTVIDANLCENSSQIQLVQPPELLLDTLTNNMTCSGVCNGEIITEAHGGVPPYTYLWSNDSYASTADELCAGEYNLILKDANNCIYSQDFDIVNQAYVPDLTISASATEIFVGEQIGLLAHSTQEGSYYWNNRELLNNSYIPNPVATPIEDVLFEVRFVDSIGCVNIDTIRIIVKEVICGDPYIFVPNAFSPNADGNNDFFKPYYPSTLVTEVYFAVYDRWGGIVYETSDLNTQGWDGTLNGTLLTTDVYVFWLKATCLNGEIYNHKGNVTLLR
jgi:gliding motility-associated-like protein